MLKVRLYSLGWVAVLGWVSLAGYSTGRGLSSLRIQSRTSSTGSPAPAVHRVRVGPSRADLRPEWVRGSKGSYRIPENTSVLNERRQQAMGSSDSEDSDSIWSLSALKRVRTVSPHSNQGRLQNQVRERIESMQSQQEYRERHGLLGQQAQLEWANQNRALGRTFLRSLLSMQIRETLQKAEKRSPEVRAVSQVQQKIDFLASTGVAVEVDEGWKFGTRADFPRQMGRVWMNSPLLNGSVDFRVGAQDTGLNETGVLTQEAVQVSVGRELLWEIQSGMTYGGSSKTMTAHVSRPLAPHLNCSVENRQSLISGLSDGRTEQTARINYQLMF